MRILKKVFLCWFVVGVISTSIHGYVKTYANEQKNEQKEEFLQKLMVTYLPKTPEQRECVKRFYDSIILVEPDSEQRVVSECKLQKLTPALQARVKSEVEVYKQILSIQDQAARFKQLASYYSTRPWTWAYYVNFCIETANTASSDCDYYRYVVQQSKKKGM